MTLARCCVLGALLLASCRRSQPGTDRFSTAGGERALEESVGPGGHFTVFRPETLVGPHAVVVFSVGTRGSPEGYRALLTHWARHPGARA